MTDVVSVVRNRLDYREMRISDGKFPEDEWETGVWMTTRNYKAMNDVVEAVIASLNNGEYDGTEVAIS